MDNYSSLIDEILANPDIDWEAMVDVAVSENLSDSQKQDIRNIMIATAKIASLATIKVLEENSN